MEHELSAPHQNRHGTWAVECSCGCSWSSAPDLDELADVTSGHGELNVDDAIGHSDDEEQPNG